MRSRSGDVNAASNDSWPFSSSRTLPLLSSLTITSRPTQWRNLFTVSTRAVPQSGPFSSSIVVAKPMGSWIVVASITKPPSSSCWCPIACAVIGYTMCASCGSSNSP